MQTVYALFWSLIYGLTILFFIGISHHKFGLNGLIIGILCCPFVVFPLHMIKGLADRLFQENSEQKTRNELHQWIREVFVSRKDL